MKKILSGLLATAVLLSSLSTAMVAQAAELDAAAPERTVAYQLYVSPDGSDQGDGSKESPFQTLEKAKEVVRTLDKSSGDIVVEIADGFYALDDTLTFGRKDTGNQDCVITYKAAEGASPVISGGDRLNGSWEIENEELNIWKIPLERDHKLRALYVNGERSYMASMEKTIPAQGPEGVYKVEKDENGNLPDWAWQEVNRFDGIFYNKSDLPEFTRNIDDIEIEAELAWNKNTVCVRSIEEDRWDHWVLKLQMPYGAIAQTPGWGVALQGKGDHLIRNAYELLDQPGEFYFDKTEKMLYYIPRQNEDLSTAEVVVPRVETLVDFVGSPKVSGDMTIAGRKKITKQVKYITMQGLTFAYADWGLQKVGDSAGKATCQAGTVLTAYSTQNWHYDLYRNLDTLPGAIQMEYAHNIKILDCVVKLTGAEGINMKNDVADCEVSGTYFYQTGGSGVVVGNPQHIYENDSLQPDYYVHHNSYDPEHPIEGATADKEKYQNGLEAIPRNIKITNNLFAKCAQLFPSNVTITSFYTENLQVEHNWLKDISYSGMSIGWGWGEFDGVAMGFRDWGEPYRDSTLPGFPTNTCRENKILNNRIDDTMQILTDGGSIYTLGKQDGTQIEGNYMRNTQFALYQDEGCANFEPIKNNVSSGKSVYTIAAGGYGRKHDLTYDNNYGTNASNLISDIKTAKVINQNFHHVEDGVWPLEAYEITLNAGMQKDYVKRYADELIALYGGAQNIVLPSSVQMNNNETLPIMGFLSAEDKIWLAPEGTTEFVEGEDMTAAPGNAETITVPTLDGNYRAYVQFSDGSVTGGSSFSVRVTNRLPKLNQHNLEMYLAGKVYEQLTIENLEDTSEAVWSSDHPEIVSVDQNGLVKALQAGSATITAKIDNDILNCKIVVKDLTVSTDALSMWFAADQGVTLAEDGASVLEWKSQTDSGVTLKQSDAAAAPQLITDENGAKHLLYDGVNDLLTLEGVDFNDKSNLSIIIVTQYQGDRLSSDWTGETKSPFFVTASGDWGSVYVSPYQEWVGARFGTGAANSQMKLIREESMETSSVTAAVKDGTTEKIYINGEVGTTKEGQVATTKNNGSTLNVGMSTCCGGLAFYYTGTVSEILVYDRTLSANEIAELSMYLNKKYQLPSELKAISLQEPAKTQYQLGEELNLEGLTVTAHYSNGSDKVVTDYQVSGYDAGIAGKQTITVTYEGITAAFVVTVGEEENDGIDRTQLEDSINAAKLAKENYPANLIEAVRVKFEAALDRAVEICNDRSGKYTQEDVDAADDELVRMLQYLSFTADIDGLKSAIEHAKEVVASGLYENDAMMSAYKDALAAAEALLDEAFVTDGEIQPAIQNLVDAEAKLNEVVIKLNLSRLQREIGLSDSTKLLLHLYIDGAEKDAFVPELSKAKALLAKAQETPDQVTQEEIDKEVLALHDARMALRLIPNKDALKSLIDSANAINQSQYTKQSISVLQAALDAANAVYADSQSDKDAVSSAEKTLKAAIGGLTLRAGDTGKDGNHGGNATTGQEEGKGGAQTGDSLHVILLGVLLIAATGVILVLRKKKSFS